MTTKGVIPNLFRNPEFWNDNKSIAFALGLLGYELNRLKKLNKPNRPVSIRNPPGSIFYVVSLKEILPLPR
jgi:hypothetical protein